MNLLGLLDRPTSGSYVLDGREVSGLKGGEVTRARRDMIGFVFQSYNLLPRERGVQGTEYCNRTATPPDAPAPSAPDTSTHGSLIGGSFARVQ